MPACFLVFPDIRANGGQIIVKFPGVFISDPADFVYNGIIHRSASSNSSGEHISGIPYPMPSTTFPMCRFNFWVDI